MQPDEDNLGQVTDPTAMPQPPSSSTDRSQQSTFQKRTIQPISSEDQIRVDASTVQVAIAPPIPQTVSQEVQPQSPPYNSIHPDKDEEDTRSKSSYEKFFRNVFRLILILPTITLILWFLPLPSLGILSFIIFLWIAAGTTIIIYGLTILSVVAIIRFFRAHFRKHIRFGSKTHFQIVVILLAAIAGVTYSVGTVVVPRIISEIKINNEYQSKVNAFINQQKEYNLSWHEVDEAKAEALLSECKVERYFFVSNDLGLLDVSYEKQSSSIDSEQIENFETKVHIRDKVKPSNTKTGIAVSAFGLTDGKVYMAVDGRFGNRLDKDSPEYDKTLFDLLATRSCTTMLTVENNTGGASESSWAWYFKYNTMTKTYH